MKRNICKRVAGFFPIIFTALSLCSCGSTAGDSSKNAVLAKEHVYRFQEAAMPDLGGDEIDICAAAHRDQTVSLLVKITDWEDYNNNDIRILSFQDDGSGAAAFPLETIPWEPAVVPDKSVLVLAGVCISDSIMQRVVDFNRNNDQYRIVVRNVVEYDSEKELAAGIAEMTESIFSGNMPDILVTDGLPAETYAANGFLADIGELIKEDDETVNTRSSTFCPECRKSGECGSIDHIPRQCFPVGFYSI